ncbi:unnamed protein product [Closterium sp. Naga37s-1]|nr:unnamed protein product [Closterium sp. Naga37s-1]
MGDAAQPRRAHALHVSAQSLRVRDSLEAGIAGGSSAFDIGGHSQSQGRRSADGAATDGACPSSRVPARRASFGSGSSRVTNASFGSPSSANEDDLSRAWDDFTASAAAAATGTVAGDSSGGVSYARHVEHQAAIARKRQPAAAPQQKANVGAKQNVFRPSASCGSLTDLVPDDSSAVEYGGGGYGAGGFGGGYGSDFSKPSKSKGNLNLGATHPPSRRGSSRPTPPPPRPSSPNAVPRPTHSRSPSASGAVGTSPPGQSRGGESTEPIRFRVNTNGRIYRSHTTPASLAPSNSTSASSPSSASAAAASASSRTRHCTIPNSLSVQDACEPTDLLNSPTIGRSIPETFNDTSAPAAVTSSAGVSPPNRGERRPTRQVSFNELVRVRRIPRHFFSADMTAAAMEIASGNDPTAGNATGGSAAGGSAAGGSAAGGSASQGTAGWQSINGVHASSPASAASAAIPQGPVGAESPGGRAGGRKGDSPPAPARSSAHSAPTQPRSAAPTSSPAPAPAPALVPTPPPGSSASAGPGGARRVGRSGSWSSTGGSAAARNALPSGGGDGSGRDGSSGGYRAVNSNGINNNGASNNGVSPSVVMTAAGRVGGSGGASRGSGGTDGGVMEAIGGATARAGGSGHSPGGSSSMGGSGMGGRNVPAFGETGAAGSGAPVRHARSRSFVERSGNDIARMAALAAAAAGGAGGAGAGGNGRGAVGGMVGRCSSVSLLDRPTADVSNRSGGSSSSGSIPLRRNSDRPERANRSERTDQSERASTRNLSVCPPSPGTRRDAFLGKPEINGCSSAGSTASSSSSSAGSGIGAGGNGGDGGSVGTAARNSSSGGGGSGGGGSAGGGSGGNRVPGPSVTSPPAPRFAPHPPSAATRSPASSARAAAAAAAGRGPPSHTLSADRLPLQRDLSGTGTFQGGVPQGAQGAQGPYGSQGPQGALQGPPQSPHQKLSSQGLPLRSPRHARHHSMGSAAALGTHPSPRATAHVAAASSLATAITAAGLVSKTAGDSVSRPRMPPSVLVGISQTLRSLSVQSVQSPSTPRSPGPHSPPPLSPRSAAPLSPRSSAPAPLSPRSFAPPLSPRSFVAAPPSPRSTAPVPLSPRTSAPLSPRSFAPPLSPRASAPLSPRASAPLSPRASAPLSPSFPATRSPIPRSNTSSNTSSNTATRTPFPPSAAAGFKGPAALDQSRARNAPAPRRHVRSASVAEVCT